MNQCTISIIVPAYNVESYIGEALQSIKDQTEAPDELILIDDGSTDRTLEVINSFEFNFPTRVVSIENSGQGNARNLGVSMASSKYIYYFDSDDLLEKSFISSMKQLVSEGEQPDIVFFSGESFNDSSYSGDRWMEYSRNFEGAFASREKFLSKGFSSNSLFCSPCLYLSKSALWGEGVLQFGGNYYEDEAVFFPLIFSCKYFLVVNDVYFYRRNRDGSTMTISLNEKHVKGLLYCIQNTLSLLQKSKYLAVEKFYIKNRLEGHCIKYITVCREAGYRVSAKELARALMVSKSLTLSIKILFLLVRGDNIVFLKSTARYLNNILHRIQR